MNDTRAIVETTFSPRTNRAYEALFTLGSGYLHARGSLEEGLSAPESQELGTFIPGVFGRNEAHKNWEIINQPSFISMIPVVDGEQLDMVSSKVTKHHRHLDMLDATLYRDLVWHTKAGVVIKLFTERFIDAVRPGLCVQRMTLHADRLVTLTLRAGIDASVLTVGQSHFTAIAFAPCGVNGLACDVHTNMDEDVFMRAQVTVTWAEASWQYEAGEQAAYLVGEITLPASATVVIEKRTEVSSSHDLAPRAPGAVLAEAALLSYDDLYAEHHDVWTARWAKSEVVVEGDKDSDHALHASIYHLMRAHVANDDRVAIDAKGFAGQLYRGRFFWDTEMYLIPFFAYTDPPRARTLTDYRIQALPAAKAIAKHLGYAAGARYPWEGDCQGREGVRDLYWHISEYQVHVTADVAYGFAHYAYASGDMDYLRGAAAETIVEIARYWMERVDWRKGDDYPSILGMFGPDEYKLMVHNGSYTNRMARFALQLAAEMGEAGGASKEECAAFADTGARLPIPRAHDGKLVLQSEDFERLAEPRFDLWKDRGNMYCNQVSHERMHRSKAIKQADVLLLMTMYPGEFTDAEVRYAWDYYIPYTTHDSSLSAGIHAMAAIRLGMREEAWKFWQRSAGLDLNVASGQANEGIHIAGAGSNWMIAVCGFGGMRTAVQSETLTFNPKLPTAWTRLAFPINWKGSQVYVEITDGQCAITNQSAQPLTVCVQGRQADIPAGETMPFIYDNQWVEVPALA